MFLCHVIFDQLTESQRLTSKRAKEVNRSMVYKVPLPCDLRSADGVSALRSEEGVNGKRVC